MSTTDPQPSEEELRAAYEAEIKRIRVEHVLLEHVVTLVNLGMRRTGLAPGTEDERDPAQVETAIEAIRSVLPLLERTAPQQIGPIREALSQLQLAFVKIGGPAAAGEAGAQPAEHPTGAQESASPGADSPSSETGGSSPGPAGPADPDQPPAEDPSAPGPAQRSGRLWVPDR